MVTTGGRWLDRLAPLLRNHESVYGAGQFTWAGLWTVTDPPDVAHAELAAAWGLEDGAISRWRLPVLPEASRLFGPTRSTTTRPTASGWRRTTALSTATMPLATTIGSASFFGLNGTHADCDNNIWVSNTFNTANRPCILGPVPHGHHDRQQAGEQVLRTGPVGASTARNAPRTTAPRCCRPSVGQDDKEFVDDSRWLD